ncbi:FUSC family protein [Francisellaceae bacterium CB300]
MQFAFLNSNKYSAINALKASIAVAIAYTVGYCLGKLLGIEQMYLWMVITVLVVMSTQPNLGGALDKALMRFLGTIIGALVGIVLTIICPKEYLVVAMLPFVVFAIYMAGASSRFSYAGTLSGITLIIIILNKNPSIQVAILRATEISLGITIALVVNRFVYPIRAETRLKQSYAKSVQQIRDFFEILFVERNDDHRKLRESLFHEFAKHLSLTKELKYEKSAKSVKEFEKMSLQIRRLYRYMIVMYEFIESQSKDITFAQLKDDKIFIEFNNYIMKSLAYVVHDIKKRRRISYQQIISFDKHIVPLLKDKYDNETFLFCVKMFLRALERLAIEHNYILQLSKH